MWQWSKGAKRGVRGQGPGARAQAVVKRTEEMVRELEEARQGLAVAKLEKRELEEKLREAEVTVRVQGHELRELWAVVARNVERTRTETAEALRGREGRA